MEYRFKQSIIKTREVRPELIDESKFSKQQLKWYKEIDDTTKQDLAISKAKKFMK